MSKQPVHVSTNDMQPSVTDELPKDASAGKAADAPETEHIADDGEPLGGNFA